jgi:hypothetical protein
VNVHFLKVARSELRQAARYYETHAGLGRDFLLEVAAAVERIKEFPAAWQKVEPELRRCQLDRFPYGLIYAEENGEVLIVALTFLERRPRSWQARLRDKE